MNTMSATHLIWLTLKGFAVYAITIAAMILAIGLLFGWTGKDTEAIPGLICGAVLMAAVVFGGLFIAVGAP